MDPVPSSRGRLLPSTVVVVDDDSATRKLVGRWLADSGLDVVEAADGEEGLALVGRDPARVAVVILDVMMPSTSGYEVLERLQASRETAAIPVVLLTAHATADADVISGIERGAVDHMEKPFRGPVLVARVRQLAEKRRRTWEIEHRLERAEAAAVRDPLTGLYNRRHFEATVAKELAYAARHKGSLAVAIVDLDHFKMVNDVFGHEGGDRVLSHFADVLKANLRVEDSAFRIGGEEFALLLRGTDSKGAVALLGRLREVLGRVPVELGDGRYFVRFSAGVTISDGNVASDELMRQADQALYAAKRTGRNRTVPSTDGRDRPS